MKLGLLCRSILLVGAASATDAATWHVDVNGAALSGDPLGTTWQNPFTSIAPAITAAASGDEIWIADGLYSLPTTLTINQSIVVRGGFEGQSGGPPETMATQAAPRKNYTVIEAPSGSRFASVTAANVSLNGLVVTGGNVGAGLGGALNYDLGSTGTQVIEDCVFVSNFGGGGGGAVVLQNLNTGTLTTLQVGRSIFMNNRGIESGSNGDGGAILVLKTNAALSVSQTYFIGNGTGDEGGAIKTDANTNTITNSVFGANTCDLNQQGGLGAANASGSAIDVNGDRQAIISHCTFAENDGERGTLSLRGADATLINCILADGRNTLDPTASPVIAIWQQTAGSICSGENNVFDDMAVIQRTGASTDILTVADLNATAEAANNFSGDPLFRTTTSEAGLTGTWTSVAAGTIPGTTVLTDTGASLPPGLFSYSRFANTNTASSPGSWSLIVANTATSITVLGDYTATTVGAPYRVASWANQVRWPWPETDPLSVVSSAIDQATDTKTLPGPLPYTAPLSDIAFQNRPIDIPGFANFAGSFGRDIGAYEAQADAPLLVDLASFTATAVRGQAVTLRWETSLEVDNAGFHVHRADAQGVVRLTPTLMAPEGSEFGGATYTFIDNTLPRGWRTLPMYFLEDVDFNGVSTIHGPAEETITEPPAPAYQGRMDGIRRIRIGESRQR